MVIPHESNGEGFTRVDEKVAQTGQMNDRVDNRLIQLWRDIPRGSNDKKQIKIKKRSGLNLQHDILEDVLPRLREIPENYVVSFLLEIPDKSKKAYFCQGKITIFDLVTISQEFSR